MTLSHVNLSSKDLLRGSDVLVISSIFESESDHVYSDSPQGKAHLLSESNGTDPVFMARRGDRSDFDVPRTRIFIYSIEGRTNWNWI